MGTRSCIILKVRKEDIGKVLKFDSKKLPVKLASWIDKDSEGKVWSDERGKNLCQPVEINSNYIAIYCHWDGYPSGVGASLLNSFHTYDEVLNLILGGSCSHIADGDIRHYANRKGEKWDYIAPSQNNARKKLCDFYRDSWAEYAYMFDEERGGWFYKDLFKRDFKPLTL